MGRGQRGVRQEVTQVKFPSMVDVLVIVAQ